MKTKNAYLIECITNLHVGSGDANYGIVDKLVQRDTVYNFPTIHASSLKGALREHFENNWKEENQKNLINDIFGKKTANDDDAQSGNVNFLNADLLALPIRCSHKQYALSFSDDVVQLVNHKSKMIIGKEILSTNIREEGLYTKENITDALLEDDNITRIDATNKNPLNIYIDNFSAFDTQFAVLDNTKFKDYAQDLPVIARNRLDKNKNLWYEEVVPHKTLFITYLISNTDNFKTFEDTLLNEFIQIGANSSVGYGLCKFHKIKTNEQ